MKRRKKVGVPVCVEVQNIEGIETNAGESSGLGDIGAHESVHILEGVHIGDNAELTEVGEHEEPLNFTQHPDIYTMEGFDFEVFDFSTLTPQGTLPPMQPVSNCPKNVGTQMTTHGVKISFGPPPPTKNRLKTNSITTQPRG